MAQTQHMYPDDGSTCDLIDRVRFAPNRAWIDAYFDLMQLLIDATGLKNDDPRLVTSIPKGKYFLPVSINNRYVLSPYKAKGKLLAAIIYGPEFEWLPEVRAQAVDHGRFDPLIRRGEGLNDTPFFVRFRDPAAILSAPDLQDAWLDAARREIRRASASPYRRYHRPVVYQAAVERAYRRQVLDRAFPAA